MESPQRIARKSAKSANHQTKTKFESGCLNLLNVISGFCGYQLPKVGVSFSRNNVVAVRGGCDVENEWLRRVLPLDLIRSELAPHLGLFDLMALCRVSRHFYHALAALLANDDRALLIPKWWRAKSAMQQRLIVERMLLPCSPVSVVDRSKTFFGSILSMFTPSQSKPLVIFFSASGHEEMREISQTLMPGSVAFLETPAYGSRVFETKGMLNPGWCTGGGNKDPHLFFCFFRDLSSLRGLVFIVEEWEYATFELG
jgi:hypothetical protein